MSDATEALVCLVGMAKLFCHRDILSIICNGRRQTMLDYCSLRVSSLQAQLRYSGKRFQQWNQQIDKVELNSTHRQ